MDIRKKYLKGEIFIYIYEIYFILISYFQCYFNVQFQMNNISNNIQVSKTWNAFLECSMSYI